ncbi:MAG: tripartite tricarboxylate transporter substrate-binding protein [Pseudomonadota bacterium]
MTIFRFPLTTVMLGCLIIQLAVEGRAQDYPSKPVRYLVPSSPGSAVDTIGRIVAAGLGEVLGQQVFVEDRAGAGGNIGAAIAAKAPADGYTLLQINNNHTTNVTLYSNLTYDLIRDFAPVAKLALSPYLIVVHPSLPVKSISDLIKLAKSRPGAITFASAGAGSGTFMATELLKSQAGLDMLHIPYVGGGPALTAVISGQTLVYGAPLSTALPHLPQSRIRALAVTSGRRNSLLPGIPTVAESVPGYEFNAWAGLLVPAKTPKEVIATIRAAVVSALNRPEVSKRLSDLGYSIVADQPDELAAFIKADIETMAKLIRQNRLTAN